MTRVDLEALAVDVYQYAYPLVLMELTRRQMTNVPDARAVPMRAPMNQFAHARAFPAADSKEVVRLNFDTLYSLAWLDLRAEPVVLSVPETDRYYLVPIYDMWSDVFAVPGTRTTGGHARDFALAAPDWAGDLPKGVELIRAPTPVVWVLGRTQTNGADDYPNVHRVQDGYRLTPLGSWGRDYAAPSGVPTDPGTDDVTPPFEQVNALSGTAMLDRLARLLKSHPPHPNDYPILHRMQLLGLRPGADFTPDALDAQTRAAINAAPDAASADIRRTIAGGSLGAIRNGWSWVENVGTYGTSYRLRAAIAYSGLGALPPEDAIYANAFADADGQALTGSDRYVLRFSAAQLPDVDAFWSVTVYDENGFLVPNALQRFVIRDRDPVRYGADGSLEIYLQHESPGVEKEVNWLPVPGGEFAPLLRLYSPASGTLRGGFNPPAIRKVAALPSGCQVRLSSCWTTCMSGAVASISTVAVARSSGSTSARCRRISSRSAGCFPYGLVVRSAILASRTSAGALSRAIWSKSW